MNKITIVTAFFDIGRADYAILKRTNEQYFEYFRFWARIRNPLVVYCESQDADRIIKIRKEYGLDAQTTIKIVDNLFSIEPEIFYKMQSLENSENFINFRYYSKALSNKAKYNYIMLMKWWCVADTAKRCQPDDFVAWLDFGYNHGGDRYTNSKDFDFLWEYDFKDKVNVFCLKNPDEVSLLDSLQFQLDCFIGHTAVIAQPLCDTYWNQMKDAMNTLLDIECMDDDQFLQLMVYKKYPSEHSIIICDWFEDFQKCSHQTFTTKHDNRIAGVGSKNDITLLRRFRIKTARIKNTLLESYRIATGKKTISDMMDPFCKRMFEKEKKYYG